MLKSLAVQVSAGLEGTLAEPFCELGRSLGVREAITEKCQITVRMTKEVNTTPNMDSRRRMAGLQVVALYSYMCQRLVQESAARDSAEESTHSST